MVQGQVVGICIAPARREPMQELQSVIALSGLGLNGDRYSTGNGSYNQKQAGQRQVTFINARFFHLTPFTHRDSRRNIATLGVELMDLIGKEFFVGEVRFRGLRYCDPCNIPSKLCGKKASFKEHMEDRGGLIAEVLDTGIIRVRSLIITPNKGY